MPDAHESCRKAPSQPHNCSRFIVYTNPCKKVQALIDFFAGFFTERVPAAKGGPLKPSFRLSGFFSMPRNVHVNLSFRSAAPSREESAVADTVQLSTVGTHPQPMTLPHSTPPQQRTRPTTSPTRKNDFFGEPSLDTIPCEESRKRKNQASSFLIVPSSNYETNRLQE